MKKVNLFLIVTVLIFCSCFYGCNTDKNKIGVDIEEREGFKTKTFYNADNNIEVIIITDNDDTLVAVPLQPTDRKKKMGDKEYECLKKCKKADGSYDLDCILLCPVTKQYKILYSY